MVTANVPNTGAQIPVVLAGTLEGFANSFRARLPPDKVEALRKLGLDLNQLRPVCPLPLWEQTIRLTGEALFPELSPEEGWVQVGRQLVRGYVETTVGRAVLSLARLLGVRRAMARMVESFQSNTNYIQASLVEIREREVEIQVWMRPEFRSYCANGETCSHVYRLGLIRGGLEILEVRDFQADLRERGSGARPTCYRIRWGE